VTPEAFVGIELLLFMAISRGSTGLVRRAASVWVADGRAGHEAVFLRDPRSDTLRRTEAPAPAEDGSAPTLDACERSMRQLAERKAVLFEEARRATLAFYEDAAEP
jgi:hypothetical protein